MILKLTASEDTKHVLAPALGLPAGEKISREVLGGELHVLSRIFPQSSEVLFLYETSAEALLAETGVHFLSRPLERFKYVHDRAYTWTTQLALVLLEFVEGLEKETELQVEMQFPGWPGSLQEELSALFTPAGYRVGPGSLSRMGNPGAMLRELALILPLMDRERFFWTSQARFQTYWNEALPFFESLPHAEALIAKAGEGMTIIHNPLLKRLSEKEDLGLADQAADLDWWATEANHSAEKVQFVVEELKSLGARRILDLGSGRGRLELGLVRESWVEAVLAIDLAAADLQMAQHQLMQSGANQEQLARMQFALGNATWKDARLSGYDSVVLLDMINCLNNNQLQDLVEHVFSEINPDQVLISSPQGHAEGNFRHASYRFEWNKEEMKKWAKKVAGKYQYHVEIKAFGDRENLLIFQNHNKH